MNIYVSHLSWGTSSEGLGNLFMQFGEVASANVITDRETGRSRGFGFVEMPNEEEGQKAIDQLNGTSFEGQTITVNVARPREERSSGGYGGNRSPGFYFRTDLRESVSPHTIRSGAVFTAPFFVFPYFPHAQRHREKERKITRGTSVFPEKSDNLPP